MASSKQELMTFGKRETKHVEIDGKKLIVQGLTDRERAEWEVDSLDDEGNRDPVAMESMRTRLIVKCLVDENGKRIFTDEESDDIGEWPAAVTVKLFKVCSELCGLDDDDIEEAKKN